MTSPTNPLEDLELYRTGSVDKAGAAIAHGGTRGVMELDPESRIVFCVLHVPRDFDALYDTNRLRLDPKRVAEEVRKLLPYLTAATQSRRSKVRQ